MKKDKVRSYIIEFLICLILFFTLFVSNVYLRWIIAIILFGVMVLVKKVLHKRNIISMHHKQTSVMLGMLAVIFVLAFYLLGLKFGYVKTLITFNVNTLFIIIIPTALIIVTSEIIRSILLAEKSLSSKILTTIGMILVDLTLYVNVSQLTTYSGLLNIISFSLCSSIACNLLWNYTSVRFGYKPAIVFRLIMTLYEFIIPVIPNVFTYLRCFLRIIYPYIIYLLLENSYSKNSFVVAVQDKKKDNIFTTILLVIMILIIMLISCEFKYGILVIGTGSMAGNIDIGDAVVFERYDEQEIKEQRVIVFNRDNMKVVHRVVDIKEVNGTKRYYTKGDANKQKDSGYVIEDDILGIVKFKIKYIGYPTLGARKLFE